MRLGDLIFKRGKMKMTYGTIRSFLMKMSVLSTTDNMFVLFENMRKLGNNRTKKCS